MCHKVSSIDESELLWMKNTVMHALRTLCACSKPICLKYLQAPHDFELQEGEEAWQHRARWLHLVTQGKLSFLSSDRLYLPAGVLGPGQKICRMLAEGMADLVANHFRLKVNAVCAWCPSVVGASRHCCKSFAAETKFQA